MAWTERFQAPGWEGKVSAWSDWYALAVSIDLLLVRVPVWIQYVLQFVCYSSQFRVVGCATSVWVKNVLWLSSRGSSRCSLPAAVVLVHVHVQEHRPSLATDALTALATSLRTMTCDRDHYAAACRRFRTSLARKVECPESVVNCTVKHPPSSGVDVEVPVGSPSAGSPGK